jgi:2-polyprenyl-3-methyl-5-hydroxy-6-metoxy-1,4-benzoquinol methylase
MSEIRFESCPRCYLCGKPGYLVHVHLEDRLFGAPGTWNFKECPDKGCGLLWMDPMPLLEDLPKAYATYYTHGAVQGKAGYRRLRNWYREMKKAHLASALGYESESVGWLPRRLSKLLFFFPDRRQGIEGEVMFMSAQPGGKLLDVGCGSGERLEKMRHLGWTVSGIDFDAEAVRIARGRGLDVSCGTIPGTWFPTETFDAVTMNHVIEHVPDPIELLKECHRILKPGGKVVLTTPNSAGWGHRLFRKYWRGLEPPRHLHLFSPASIEQILRRAGFELFSVRTTASAYVWRQSFMLRLDLTNRSAGDVRLKIANLLSLILNSAEHLALKFNAKAGEGLWVVANKSLVPQRLTSEIGISTQEDWSGKAAEPAVGNI